MSNVLQLVKKIINRGELTFVFVRIITVMLVYRTDVSRFLVKNTLEEVAYAIQYTNEL